jgi:hypothetical protein
MADTESTEQMPPINIDAGQLNNINSLINQFNSEKNIGCDAECQQNQDVHALYQAYVNAQNTLREAPQNVERTEKEYYVADKGAAWFSNFQVNNAQKSASSQIAKIETSLTKVFKDIKQNIGYYNSQLLYKKRINQLLADYNQKLIKTEKKIRKLDSKKNVANRLTTYHERDMEWSDTAYWYMRRIYWSLAAIITLIVFWRIYKKKYVGEQMKAPLITVAILLLLPVSIMPLILTVVKK